MHCDTHIISVFVTGDGDVEIVRHSRALYDILLLDAEVGGYRANGDFGSGGSEAQDAPNSQSLP